MLPNITIIVATYVAIRLVTIAVRQFPEAEKMLAFRGAVFALSVVGIGVALHFMVDTIMLASKSAKDNALLPSL